MGNGFFQRKTASKVLDKDRADTVQQIKELNQQVIALKQKVKLVDQQKENIKLQYETLKQGKLKESEALLDEKKETFEKILNECRTKSEEKISSLEQEVASKNERLEKSEADLLAEKDKLAKLSQEFEENQAVKESEVIRLTKEKLEIKSQVSEVLLELQEHFAYKTALLETERDLLTQEKEKQEAVRLQKLEECEALVHKTQDEAVEMIEAAKTNAKQMVSKAQDEIAEKEAQSKEELSRLKARIEYYSVQINEAAQTIEALLGSIDHL